MVQSVDAMVDVIAERIWQRLESRMEPHKVQPRLLSVKDAADYLGRSAHSVQHLCDSGKLPTVRIDNRIFLDVRDLDRVIEDAKQVAI